MKFDYAKPLAKLLYFNLDGRGGGVEPALEVMENYNLTPETLKEHLVSAIYPHNVDPFAGLSA